MLSTTDHSRDKAGLIYVYPVLSRRSGGLSIGINLNINNACNWRCIYCQVPNLKRGSAPPVNLDKLAQELRNFLDDVVQGDFYHRENVPEELQRIKDIAISGNGEPTTSNEFNEVVNLIELVLSEYRLLNKISCVLISNGSRVNRTEIQQGMVKLAGINGEIWFKIDSATAKGIAAINQVRGSKTSVLRRLKITAELCPTWIQTCFFSFDDKYPDKSEVDAYLDLLNSAIEMKIPLKGVMLYGVERPSMQPEAEKIKKLPAEWFAPLASTIKSMGINVKLTP